jgi:hypothetical protein
MSNSTSDAVTKLSAGSCRISNAANIARKYCGGKRDDDGSG